MKQIWLSVGVSLAILPAAANAEGVNLSGGVALASSYDLTTSSSTQADYPLSFYMQLEKKDFYGKLWLGTLPSSLSSDEFEIAFTLGWSTHFNNGVGLDLSYTESFMEVYKDRVYDSADLVAVLSYGMTDGLVGSFEVGYDLENEKTYAELGLDFALNDRWSLQGLSGTESSDGFNYYEFGATYAVSDKVAFNILYEGDETSGNNGLLTFTLSYDFSL